VAASTTDTLRSSADCRVTAVSLAWLYLVGLSVITIYDALSPRFLPLQKELQAAFYIAVLVFAVGVTLMTKAGRIGRPEFYALAIPLLFFIPVPLQKTIQLKWIFGDYLLLTAPFAVFSLIRMMPALLRGAQWRFLFVLLAAGALVAPMFSDPSDRNRFEPPSLLLMSMVWVGCLRSRTMLARAFFGSCLIALLVLSWYSQWRGAVVALVVIGAVLIVLTGRSLSRTLWIFVLVLSFVVVAAIVARDKIASVVFESRFSEIAEGGVESDDSLMFRFVEARDVLNEINREWGPLNFLIGAGLGASFRPEAVLSQMSDRYAEGNLTGDRVHNVHLGPLAIFFRFGVIGIVLFAWVWWKLFRDFWTYLVTHDKTASSPFLAGLGATLLYLLLFNVYNTPNQTLFPATVGLYMAARAERQKRRLLGG
jgi:hypothetical protein